MQIIYHLELNMVARKHKAKLYVLATSDLLQSPALLGYCC